MATDAVIEDFDDDEICGICPVCRRNDSDGTCPYCGATEDEECEPDCPSWDEED